ncbi:unnamed protein product, partial [Iphiclides podalirius]
MSLTTHQLIVRPYNLSRAPRAEADCHGQPGRGARLRVGRVSKKDTDSVSCTWVVWRRSVGRYRYLRDSDGLQQWERPALDNTDMDISTTPPHPGIEHKEEVAKSQSPPPAPPPPAPPSPRAVTPPPPKWPEPPPPGCDEPPPLPPEPVVAKEIGDELMSFYNDIAELEKGGAPTEPQEPQEAKDKERDKDSRPPKKKPKVKISTSMGLKHKSVSSLVAKWQQVAEEINSD